MFRPGLAFSTTANDFVLISAGDVTFTAAVGGAPDPANGPELAALAVVAGRERVADARVVVPEDDGGKRRVVESAPTATIADTLAAASIRAAAGSPLPAASRGHAIEGAGFPVKAEIAAVTGTAQRLGGSCR